MSDEQNMTIIPKFKKSIWIVLAIAIVLLYVYNSKANGTKLSNEITSSLQDIKCYPDHKGIDDKIKALTVFQAMSLQQDIRLLNSAGFKSAIKVPGDYYKPERPYIEQPSNIYEAIRKVRSLGYYVIHADDVTYDNSKDLFLRTMRDE